MFPIRFSTDGKRINFYLLFFNTKAVPASNRQIPAESPATLPQPFSSEGEEDSDENEDEEPELSVRDAFQHKEIFFIVGNGFFKQHVIAEFQKRQRGFDM